MSEEKAVLGPDTFEQDINAGRARIMLPGGSVHDVERMICVVAATGFDNGIKMFIHPAFEDEAKDVARQLARDLLAYADGTDG